MSRRRRHELSDPQRPVRDMCERAEAAFRHADEIVGAFMRDEVDRAELALAFAALTLAVRNRRATLGPAPVPPSRRKHRMPR